MPYLSTALATLGLALSCAAYGQHLPSKPVAKTADIEWSKLERVSELLHRYVDQGHHAGVSYLMFRHGHLIGEGQIGYKNIAKQSKIMPDTIFRIYSMSKPVTSVAALQLMEAGHINLNDPISKWLPELKDLGVYNPASPNQPIPAETPITVRMLLNHTAGFTYDFFEGSPVHALYKEQDLWNSPNLDEFISRVAKLPLLSNPGTEFHYGIGLDVLGLIIERVAGQPFPDYLRDNIFNPLRMKSTGFYVPASKRNRLATLHQHGEDGALATVAPILGAYAEKGRGIPSGGGGLFSTISDYARFAQMLLNNGTLEGERILSRKTMELARENSLTETTTPYNEFSPSDGWCLLGAVRLDVGRSQELGSRGMFYWSGAATTHFFVDPTESLVGLVFTQHIPFDEHNLFSPFRNTIYQALE